MVTGILIISTLAYHFTRSKEEKIFNYAYLQNTSVSIQSILKDRERSMNQNLENNSAWDMMVDFAAAPDSAWAVENLNTTRQTLNLDFIQIYSADFKPAWAIYNTETRAGFFEIIGHRKLQNLFQSASTCHFFEITDAGLLELYGSIIVPSTDIARKTRARGYLFFGKLWDNELLSDVENSSNSLISMHFLPGIGNERQPHVISKDSREIAVFLKDYTGRNIVRLDFLSKSFYKADTRLFYLLTLIPFALALIVLCIFYILIRKWISIPVHKITQSLNRQDSEGLKGISSGSPEFLAISNLVAESFQYRKNLENEIIERKKAEEKILKYAGELQEINLSKDKFFSILAHDLKSPFHYLLGYSDLLRNEYATLSDEERKKFVSIIHSNSQRLYNLLENLLAWSRLQTGRMDFELELFDLSKEIKQLVETVRVSAVHKHITIESVLSENTLLNADRNMIRSAIHNLLTNAIKYTPENGLVSIRSNSTDVYVEVSIKDNGVGMSPDEMAKLFRIDVSVSRPGTNKEPGTGLGLILSKEFIEKNGGSIYVESEPEKGSHFRVTLPLYKV